MNRPLNLFDIDGMIEQFNRFNPVPDHADNIRREQVSDQMDSELLCLHLQELKILKSKVQLYEIKIKHQDRELRELTNDNKDMQRLLMEVMQATPQDKDCNFDPINQPQAYKIKAYFEKKEKEGKFNYE